MAGYRSHIKNGTAYVLSRLGAGRSASGKDERGKRTFPMPHPADFAGLKQWAQEHNALCIDKGWDVEVDPAEAFAKGLFLIHQAKMNQRLANDKGLAPTPNESGAKEPADLSKIEEI